MERAASLSLAASEFKFPTSCVGNPDFAPPAMDLDDRSEYASSNLSDSTYEIVSQSSLHTSDAGSVHDESESLHSFGQHLSTEEREDTETTGDGEMTEPESIVPAHAIGSDSNDDIVDDQEIGGHLETPSIQQSQVDQSSHVTVRHSRLVEDIFMEETMTLQHRIEGQYLVDLRADGKGRVSICQKMSPKTLDLQRPLKIAYLGDQTIKMDIMEKIAQALAVAGHKRGSHHHQTHLNIVPVSSFLDASGRAPQITLIPSTGAAIHVEDCSRYTDVHSGLRNTLWVSRRRKACLPDQRRLPMPDLIVTTNRIISKDEHSSTGTIKFFALPSIPILALDPAPLPSFETAAEGSSSKDADIFAHLPFFDSLPHLIFESAENRKPVRVAKPLTLSVFLDLDAEQLSRSLEYAVHPPSRVTKLRSYAVRQWTSLSTSCASTLGPIFDRGRKDMAGIASRASTSSLIYFIPLFIVLAFFTINCILSTSSLHNPVSELPHTEIIRAETTLATTVPQITWEGSQGLSIVKEESSLSVVEIPRTSDLPTSKSKEPGFEIFQSAEDGRLYLRVSKQRSQSWKPQKSFIHILQGETPTTATLSKLNLTMYEICLDPGRAKELLLIGFWPVAGNSMHHTYLIRPASIDSTTSGLQERLLTYLTQVRGLSSAISSGLWPVKESVNTVVRNSASVIRKGYEDIQQRTNALQEKNAQWDSQRRQFFEYLDQRIAGFGQDVVDKATTAQETSQEWFKTAQQGISSAAARILDSNGCGAKDLMDLASDSLHTAQSRLLRLRNKIQDKRLKMRDLHMNSRVPRYAHLTADVTHEAKHGDQKPKGHADNAQAGGWEIKKRLKHARKNLRSR